ncbi:secreted protein [Pyronema omphalodes]|nr:secreted protein [Pyronema omphalodes]
MQFPLFLTAALLLCSSGTLATPLEKRQNNAELAYCIKPVNISKCIAARNHANEATLQAQLAYTPDQLHNGRGDAFRHCYWNARMTIDMGGAQAKIFGDLHEMAPGQPQNERNMDLANNAMGIIVGQQTGSRGYEWAKQVCMNLANTGRLTTLK